MTNFTGVSYTLNARKKNRFKHRETHLKNTPIFVEIEWGKQAASLLLPVPGRPSDISFRPVYEAIDLQLEENRFNQTTQGINKQFNWIRLHPSVNIKCALIASLKIYKFQNLTISFVALFSLIFWKKIKPFWIYFFFR